VPADRAIYEPLTAAAVAEVAAALDDERVYRFIGGRPARRVVEEGLRRALLGPPADAHGETWLNFVVRDAASRDVLGRLEATLHHDIGEVAFLYAPRHWGQGLATQGLVWLHAELRARSVSELWAATSPLNATSAALLARCGYVRVTSDRRPLLYAYEDGDLVFAARNDAGAGSTEGGTVSTSLAPKPPQRGTASTRSVACSPYSRTMKRWTIPSRCGRLRTANVLAAGATQA
jgi:RimJ/RimL family protein N-acetyltransferase